MPARKYLDLSTRHLPTHDANILNGEREHEAIPISVYPTDNGWLVNVPPKDTVTDAELNEVGFTTSFLCLLDLARKNECWWILFDCDSEAEPDLPTFEW
jgi:hypothetical protein